MATKNMPPAGDTGAEDRTDAGDTAEGSTDTGAGGDTSDTGDASGETGDVEALHARIAELEDANKGLASKLEDVTRDRDKASRKRDSQRSDFEARLTAMETMVEEQKKARQSAEAKLRGEKARATVLEGVHPDHRSEKSTRRLLKAIEAEGVDLEAEDNEAAIKKAAETLKSDHPSLFEPKQKAPRVPKLGEGGQGNAGEGGPRLI